MAVSELSPSTEITEIAEITPVSPSDGLARQMEGERMMVRWGSWGIVIALPITIAIFVGAMAIAMSDKQPWFVWIGLGVAMGFYAAAFFGSMTAILVVAGKLDHAERATLHDVAA